MKYEYLIYSRQYGGEYTIGTLDKKVGDYWLDKEQSELENYVFSNWDEEKDKLNKSIPKEYQLGYWHDYDDIEHMNCAEYDTSNYLVVEDNKTNEEIAEINHNPDMILESCIYHPFSAENYKDEWKDKHLIYGQSFEKGGFTYEVVMTDKPFDASKLKICLTVWSNQRLIHGIEYDGVEYCAVEADTIGKSMHCWIEHLPFD